MNNEPKTNETNVAPTVTENNQNNFVVLAGALAQTLLNKNRTYGNSYDESIDTWGKRAIGMRLEDKYNRIKYLLLHDESGENDESLVDSLLDNAGYSLLALNYLICHNDVSIKDLDKINAKAKFLYTNVFSVEKSALIEAFNSNQIDLFYGINSNNDYALDVYNTINVYDNSAIVLKHSSNNKIINSIKSLNNVVTIENSKLAQQLVDNNITVTAYANMEDIINNINDDSIIVLDTYNYNYYADKLKDFIIAYQYDIDDYSFVNRDISDNKVFNEFLDFFIRFNDSKQFITLGLGELMLVDTTPIILKNIAVVLGSIFGILLIVLAIIKIKPKKKVKILSKEDKLRYIDALTSLKNRTYLNDSIERWDSTDIYPQSIIIIDLNNIAYINDNYGHAEGDDVIKQAANILIVNQIENSEIIRTNGNEFLVYLIGYEEKQVITYMRKLGKELKELKHGFGSAMGYSMINDAIKTIDDAINEATLDMKNNKEESR